MFFSGIGIVNAIEVVNAFEGEVGLKKFREWLDAPDYTLLDKVEGDGMKKMTKKKNTKGSNVDEDTDDIADDRSATVDSKILWTNMYAIQKNVDTVSWSLIVLCSLRIFFH